MAYAIISLGGKQYRVQEGERLLVDRVKTDEGKTLNPDVLFFGDGAKTELSPKGVTVTARVVGHVRGEKIRIGKYRRRTGYRRHTGFRAALTELEIEKIGGARAAKAAAPKAEKEKAKDDHVRGMPRGYEEMTVAQVADGATHWRRPQLEAALEYERAHAARKGAISALESALGAKEEH